MENLKNEKKRKQDNFNHKISIIKKKQLTKKQLKNDLQYS